MSTQTMKQGIRQSIIAARQKMATAEQVEFSRLITASLIGLKEYQRAQVVLGYMSFGAEFATLAWVQHALQNGKQVLLPKVNKSSRQLDLYHVVDLQNDVAPGLWGIPEPLPDRCRKIDALEQVDFILLPGVAFARDGSRLGYGGGFYDKLLARIDLVAGNLHPALVAAAFAMQLVKDIPQEGTDRKVECLVTEKEVIDCGA